MGSLFDATHVAYILGSLALTVLLLFVAARFLTSRVAKSRFLKVFGLLTFFLHISTLWNDFLRVGSASVPDNVLFPIFFCNLSMYMLLIVSFWEHREGKVYRWATVMTAYGGFFGAMISLIYPEYYLGSTIADWAVLKSMLSHSTMLVGALWLFIGGYVPLRKANAGYYAVGLLVYGGIGLLVNGLFAAAGLNPPNAMYLQHPPLAELPIFSCYAISLLMLLAVYASALVADAIRTAKASRSAPTVEPQ